VEGRRGKGGGGGELKRNVILSRERWWPDRSPKERKREPGKKKKNKKNLISVLTILTYCGGPVFII